jgi:hypothetical protein
MKSALIACIDVGAVDDAGTGDLDAERGGRERGSRRDRRHRHFDWPMHSTVERPSVNVAEKMVDRHVRLVDEGRRQMTVSSASA